MVFDIYDTSKVEESYIGLNGCLPRLERAAALAALLVVLTVGLAVGLAVLTVITTASTTRRRRGRRRHRHRAGVVVLVRNLVLIRLLRI